MFSDNIIERHQAMSDLMSNPMAVYALTVAALMVICWKLKDFI
jgi:hypothetical protein